MEAKKKAEKANEDISVKIVLVGDCMCGKTALVHSYTNNTFSESYIPTGFDKHSAIYTLPDNYRIHISIWDTSGDEGVDGVRPLSYDGCHLVIITFSLADVDSFENVIKKWLPEVREQCKNQPIILVGCKSDLRSDDTLPIKLKDLMATYEQGLSLAKDIGALVYTETSAKTSPKSVKDMFEVAALSAAATLSTDAKPKRTFSLLHKSFNRQSHPTDLEHAKRSSKNCAVM